MALTCSIDGATAATLDASSRERLLAAARRAICDGLEARAPRSPSLDGHPPALCATAATFVTLEQAGALRGCVGTLDACRPLLMDAALNAHAAAFDDPRFEPLTHAELAALAIQVSVLGAMERLRGASEAEVLARLRPGVDGLILREGRRRGTFLPVVWTSVGDPRAFLAALKHKIGLPPDYWSDTIEVARYTTYTVS